MNFTMTLNLLTVTQLMYYVFAMVKLETYSLLYIKDLLTYLLTYIKEVYLISCYVVEPYTCTGAILSS